MLLVNWHKKGNSVNAVLSLFVTTTNIIDGSYILNDDRTTDIIHLQLNFTTDDESR